jgi:hypothetical protein
VLELQFGRTAPTIPVLDGEPGQELQVDTGWVGWLTLPLIDTRKRRRFRAWIFTAVRSRYRFVYPTFEETTARAIEACEAAWAFFGGRFHVLIPDNTKAIILEADPLAPRITPAFLEYVQARDLHIDAARVRHARDKARVERAVPGVRDDCFAGEILTTLEDARAHALQWCRDDYGWRPHSRTQRRPREHFEAEELAALRPAPTTPYDIPLWSEPKVGRDQLVAVAKALYSVPHRYVRADVTARADQQIVRFYHHDVLIKTHPRQLPGGRSIDPADYPVERSVYALLGLVRRYGAARVTEVCTAALAADLIDVRRLQRMLELASTTTPASTPSARVIPLARYLRPASQYALPLRPAAPSSEGGESE